MVAMSNPEHPAVNWSQTRRNDEGRWEVELTCPWCKKTRWDDASQVRYRVKKGGFTGFCYRDRLTQQRRKGRLPRPEHPAVDWHDTHLKTEDSRRRTQVAITCPKCGEKRYLSPGPIAAKIRDNKFTGICLPCSPRAHYREWVELSPGRKLDPIKGYVRLLRSGVPPEHRDLWKAMKGPQSSVMEHRFVMALQLGRPLKTTELVDHMDGDKTNNDPSNLRIYRRGHNDPGSHNGHGTFYDEWQRAEARVRELEALLAEH